MGDPPQGAQRGHARVPRRRHGALRPGPYGRLVGLIRRYGDPIEADLWDRGIDLLDLWRGRITARQVLNIISRLPRDSHFIAALADDDELAEELLAQEDEDAKAPPPPLTEFGPVGEKLTLIADRLGELITITTAANSKKKPPPYKPLPRPVTARQRVKRRARERKRDLVLERLAEARTLGRPSMADIRADDTHTAVRR